MHASMAVLTTLPGGGVTTAARLVAALELGQRLARETPDNNAPYTIRAPADAASLLSEMSALEQEEMRVILLNTRNQVMGTVTAYKGNLNSAVIRIGELFREAIRQSCAAIIVAHNHPSHDPSPSPEDAVVTKQIVEAGKLMDIDVMDHLVIGGAGKFVSLKERGLGFEETHASARRQPN